MKKKTILFVYANIKVNESLMNLLVLHEEFNMIFVSSIDETLEAINKNVIDLIVVDPVMGIESKILTKEEIKNCEDGLRTGFVLVQKARDILPQIPVVFYTRLESGIIRESFEDAGYVQLPAIASKIVEEVQRVLN